MMKPDDRPCRRTIEGAYVLHAARATLWRRKAHDLPALPVVHSAHVNHEPHAATNLQLQLLLRGTTLGQLLLSLHSQLVCAVPLCHLEPCRATMTCNNMAS